MMKQILLILLFIIINITAKAQTDTIEITQFKSSQLIFNEDITFVEAGTGDLQVKTKIVDNILIIQSIVPQEDFISTNLFIKTGNNVYNPILKYSNAPKRATLLAQNLRGAISSQNNSKASAPAGNANTTLNVQTTTNDKKQSNYTLNQNTSEEKSLIQNIANLKDEFKPSRQYTTDVWFRFLAHYIHNQKFYFKISIQNDSDLDYNLDHFFFSVKSTKKRNATETQRSIEPIKFLNQTDNIEANSTKILIFEFNTFSINKNEEFLIELKEKNGARNFVVGVPYYIINQPLPLKK